MVIRRSSSREVEALVADLARATAGDSGARDAAIARLRIIGARAVPHLLEAWRDGGRPDVRVAVLQALEGNGDPRVTPLVLQGLDDQSVEVRVAAAGAARWLLEGERSAEVLDRLTAAAVESSEPAPVRVAAITALQDLPRRVLAPVLARLAGDGDPAVRAAAHRDITAEDTPEALLADGGAGSLPADPQILLQALANAGAGAPLPTLHRLVRVIREREDATSDLRRRPGWTEVRGALHRTLAARGSRVALYDLRETVRAASGQLPDGYLWSLAEIGDGEALDDLAAACARGSADPGDPWVATLRATARAIVRRERLTARHAAVKRLHARWGAAAALLLG